jgi:hypothetical protein
VSENVAANVGRFGVKAGVKARTEFWTYKAESAFLAYADQTDPMIALGERLLAYTGQWPGDTRAMLLTDFDGSKVQPVIDDHREALLVVHRREFLWLGGNCFTLLQNQKTSGTNLKG